jgi:hypothetical protein
MKTNKYIRTHPEKVHRAPKHRLIGYGFGLDFDEPRTEEEFVAVWKETYDETSWATWTDEKEQEVREALEWMVANGIAEVVE